MKFVLQHTKYKRNELICQGNLCGYKNYPVIVIK